MLEEERKREAEAAAELKKMADAKMAPLVAAARAAGEVPQEVSFEMLRQLNDDDSEILAAGASMSEECREMFNHIHKYSKSE